MIMLTEKLEKKLKQLPKMGAREASDFKAKVINSLLDNPTKFYVIEKIDNRLKSLDKSNSLAESGDIHMGDLK